jgi:aerobic-type carbon monoxide dehydrogenase small subunit (CoxS/CutS family)
VRLIVNGEARELSARSDETLLAVLRREGFLSVRETCAIGVCGACTILVDGAPMSGCLLLARGVEGREVTTIEGLGGDDPVQHAFVSANAFQCGYCTPGMILAAVSLLQENPHPTDDEVRVGLEGNLCRCTGYHNIVKAVQAVAVAIAPTGEAAA